MLEQVQRKVLVTETRRDDFGVLTGSVADRLVSLLRMVLALTLVLSCAYMARRSFHWPMLIDSPIMHYVNFLLDHGMRPYQEITDNNMPGAYLTEGWAMQVFGGGDLAWRVYDFFLLGVMTAAMTAIAWPYDRLAGVYAGGLFSLMHISEGPWFAGEREEVMAALLLVSCACLFMAVRGRRPWMAAPFGFAAALAASIKPTMAPFAIFALLLLAVALRRRQERSGAYILWGLGGMLLAVGINLAFLLRHGALRPLLFVLRTVTPAYVGLNRPGRRFLVEHIAPADFAVLFGLAAVGIAVQRRWNWERTVLLLGVVLGSFSYFLQGKGFFHHRYLLVVFALLLAGTELMMLTRRRGWMRLLGLAGVLLPLLWTVPGRIRGFEALPQTGRLVRSMETDLRELGGDRLQGQVQCFDLVYGCLNSLYHLGLVENTGFTGDLLLFTRERNAATEYYRDRFWATQAKAPAEVLVITNEVFGESNSFRKIERWPEFHEYLAKQYTLLTERAFPREDMWGSSSMPLETARAYRIYVRRGSGLGAAGGGGL